MPMVKCSNSSDSLKDLVFPTNLHRNIINICSRILKPRTTVFSSHHCFKLSDFLNNCLDELSSLIHIDILYPCLDGNNRMLLERWCLNIELDGDLEESTSLELNKFIHLVPIFGIDDDEFDKDSVEFCISSNGITPIFSHSAISNPTFNSDAVLKIHKFHSLDTAIHVSVARDTNFFREQEPSRNIHSSPLPSPKMQKRIMSIANLKLKNTHHCFGAAVESSLQPDYQSKSPEPENAVQTAKADELPIKKFVISTIEKHERQKPPTIVTTLPNGTTTTTTPWAQTRLSPPVSATRRRTSRLSFSSTNADGEEIRKNIQNSITDEEGESRGIPYRSRNRKDSFGSSTGGESYGGHFVGSYEESLLSRRMSSLPSKPIQFLCEIGVIGFGKCRPALRCPPHIHTSFKAYFYEFLDDESPCTPYVGSIDVVDEGRENGYRIPVKGQLQIIIKNPSKTAVKVFLIPYDFSDMPPNSKTFLRQKSYYTPSPPASTLRSPSPLSPHSPHEKLKFAIHLQFHSTAPKKIFLSKSIRVVFASGAALNDGDKLRVVCEGPHEPKYSPLSSSPLKNRFEDRCFDNGDTVDEDKKLEHGMKNLDLYEQEMR